jgi:hypothetical protein
MQRNIYPFLSCPVKFLRIASIIILSRDGVRYRRGLGLEMGFIDHFNTRPMTILNYRAIADLHNLQITTALAKSFLSAVSSPVVPW